MAKKTVSKKSTETTSVHNATQALVKKVWGFCDTLRDDGVGASEYLEQLTYLLFLKMIDELGKEIPKEYSWPVLRLKSGSELSEYYTELLTNLAKSSGMVGQIFYQAKNSINKPATLARLVVMIDQQIWTGLDADLKGNLYEEILEKTASEKLLQIRNPVRGSISRRVRSSRRLWNVSGPNPARQSATLRPARAVFFSRRMPG